KSKITIRCIECAYLLPGAAIRPRSDADVVHVALEKSDHADEDQVKRHDVVEQPRHEKDQDAGDQRHQRRDGDTQGHAYFLPLEASCMSRPACSTASPALPIALSTWRPARSAGPLLSAPSRLQAATTASTAATAA